MNRRAGRWRFAVLAVLVLGLTACAGPGYYLQATRGHFDLMGARQPVDGYLASADADDPLAARLTVARTALAFAESRLALPTEGSFEQFVVTGRDGVSWNVVATPPYDLAPKRWCFPVAGCVPYLGYFDEQDARRHADRLADRGMDSAVFLATAYSTLGWFDDPILDTMLSGSDAELADTLFHELAHQRLYVPGDSRFNESYATFVAREGVRSWMIDRGDEADFAAWQDAVADRARFTKLLAETRAELAAFYAGEDDETRLAQGKAKHFNRLRERYDALVATHWQGRNRFGGWFESPPNNARLALVATYTGGLCAFERLWADADGDFARFHELAQAMGEATAARRAEFLATPCN